MLSIAYRSLKLLGIRSRCLIDILEVFEIHTKDHSHIRRLLEGVRTAITLVVSPEFAPCSLSTVCVIPYCT